MVVAEFVVRILPFLIHCLGLQLSCIVLQCYRLVIIAFSVVMYPISRQPRSAGIGRDVVCSDFIIFHRPDVSAFSVITFSSRRSDRNRLRGAQTWSFSCVACLMSFRWNVRWAPFWFLTYQLSYLGITGCFPSSSMTCVLVESAFLRSLVNLSFDFSFCIYGSNVHRDEFTLSSRAYTSSTKQFFISRESRNIGPNVQCSHRPISESWILLYQDGVRFNVQPVILVYCKQFFIVTYNFYGVKIEVNILAVSSKVEAKAAR